MWKEIETLLAAEYRRVTDDYPWCGDMSLLVINRVTALLERVGFQYLGSGRHRSVYRSPNGRYVVKVPHCFEGVGANGYEGFRWRRRNAKRGGTGYPIAPCREICGGMLLVMQYVKPASQKNEDELPVWVDCVDGQQVGYTSSGKLVAYDYGS